MKLRNILLILALAAFSACNPKYYSPNTQNVPLISRQGDINLTAAGNGNQVELLAAMGATESLAIMANAGLYIPSDMDNGNGGDGQFGEVGLGYYSVSEDNTIFETYALIGFGALENRMPSTIEENPETEGKISANVFRFALQPNFGYKSKNLEMAVSSRFALLSYSNIVGDLIFDGKPQKDYLSENNLGFLVEPAFTVRGGLENVKMQAQFGYSLNVTNSDFRQDKAFMTLGFNFSF